MFDDGVLERGARAALDAGVPPATQEPSWQRATTTDVTAKVPAPKNPEQPQPRNDNAPSIAKPAEKGFLRRRPVLSAIGALLRESFVGKQGRRGKQC